MLAQARTRVVGTTEFSADVIAEFQKLLAPCAVRRDRKNGRRTDGCHPASGRRGRKLRANRRIRLSIC
jgi:hypothetical protein